MSCYKDDDFQPIQRLLPWPQIWCRCGWHERDSTTNKFLQNNRCNALVDLQCQPTLAAEKFAIPIPLTHFFYLMCFSSERSILSLEPFASRGISERVSNQLVEGHKTKIRRLHANLEVPLFNIGNSHVTLSRRSCRWRFAPVSQHPRN